LKQVASHVITDITSLYASPTECKQTKRMLTVRCTA